MDNSFNLIDEPWIPIKNYSSLVSLKTVFSNDQLEFLGGDPIQKIALMKLLLAIAQAAYTPQDKTQWSDLGSQGLAKCCLDYLEKWHDRFYLYGEHPFLQLPQVAQAKSLPISTIIPYVATGNTTCLTQYHNEKPVSKAEQALLLLIQMSMPLGGKKADNNLVLTPHYRGKTKDDGKVTTPKWGSSLGRSGFLHSFALGRTLQETVWLNLFTHDEIESINIFAKGMGQAPWEHMPQGEDCPTAQALKQSLMGRLIPFCRFAYLGEDGKTIYLTEGITHLNYKDGLYDPSITIKKDTKEPKAVWVDLSKGVWRELVALLGFLSSDNNSRCLQLQLAFDKKSSALVGLWSGGVKVSHNAGEHYISGSDDTLESTLLLGEEQQQEGWFENYKQALNDIDQLAKIISDNTKKYFAELGVEGKDQADRASKYFWQCCESKAQQLINNCEDSDKMLKIKRQFYDFCYQAFDMYCPNTTAKQMNAWAKTRPMMRKITQNA